MEAVDMIIGKDVKLNTDLSDIAQRERCRFCFRTLVEMRHENLRTLSYSTGIPYKTIQSYYNGKTDIRTMRAVSLFQIAQVLECDPLVLVGARPMDSLFDDYKPET